jgi:hypothetical protein
VQDFVASPVGERDDAGFDEGKVRRLNCVFLMPFLVVMLLEHDPGVESQVNSVRHFVNIAHHHGDAKSMPTYGEHSVYGSGAPSSTMCGVSRGALPGIAHFARLAGQSVAGAPRVVTT